MNSTDYEDPEVKGICARCVGEQYLKSHIRTSGIQSVCSYCDCDGLTIEIEALADIIDRAFEAHYVRTDTEPEGWEYAMQRAMDYEWERGGEQAIWAIAEAVDVEEEIANDIREILVPKFLFDEHFTQERVLDGEIIFNSLESYVASIPPSAKAWRYIHDPHSIDIHNQTQEGLVRLQRVSHGAFVPLLMAALQSQTTESSPTHSLIRSVEAFRFAVGAICRRKSNTGDSHFHHLAYRLFCKHQTIEGAIQEIDQRTKNHFNLDRAISEFENRFRWQKGFYSWHHLRFLLFEYEQEVRREVGLSYTKLNWEEFNVEQRSDFVTVEHILPDKPRKGEWPSFEHFNDTELHRLTHSLGNLLPLSQSRNSHLSNRAFRIKCGDDGKVRGYSEGCCSEIKVSKRPEWTPQEIVNRGLDILIFIENRWGLDFGDRLQRLQLLGLAFMEEELSNSSHQFPVAKNEA